MKKELKELEKYLPMGWEEASKEQGALCREREIKTASELLEAVMLYLTIGESYGTTASLLSLTTGITISKQALRKRISGSWRWLKWLCEQMCNDAGMRMPKPDWLEREVIAVDGSEMSLKGSNQGDYRLHCAFDIFGFNYRTLEITGVKEGEKLSRHMVKPGDIILADRMYGNIKGMEHVRENGGDFILRYRTKGFNLYNAAGEKLDLIKEFNSLAPMQSLSVECFYYSEGKRHPVRIVAMRKDEASIEATHKRMKKKIRKQRGKAPSAQALEFNQYIVLATSLDYSNERILELYRARWQIEQVFLRLKEMYGFGEVPSSNEDSVKAWFYGKLFLAVLAQVIMTQECFSPTEQELLRSANFVELVEYT